MTDNAIKKSCQEWEEMAMSCLAGSLEEASRSEVRDHLRQCERCWKEYGELFGLDRSLQHAFQAFDSCLQPPGPERSRGIWEAVNQPPEAALLFKKTRRLANTLLWIAVLALSLSGLLALAWKVYWYLMVRKGPG
ncbi:MAG: zf-HC2 domain-containing protein [Planctomycetes bacterium]|nr:zf-HC2 domain-containing protein [Planctomycetota bacterium]